MDCLDEERETCIHLFLIFAGLILRRANKSCSSLVYCVILFPAASVTTHVAAAAALEAFLCATTRCIWAVSLFCFVRSYTNIILLHQLLSDFIRSVPKNWKAPQGRGFCCRCSRPVFTPLNLSDAAGKIPVCSHMPAAPDQDLHPNTSGKKMNQTCWTSHLERLSSVKALPCLMPWQCYCLVGFQCKKNNFMLKEKKKISFRKMGKRAAASGATVWTFVDRPSPSNSAVLWSQLTWQPNRVIAMSHDARWPPKKETFS